MTSISRASGIVTNTVVYNYLEANIAKVADTVTSNTATFNNTSFKLAPIYSGLPDTAIDDFKIYVNGINLPTNAISGWEKIGNNIVLTINTSVTGWEMKSHWTVIATGRFAS